MEKEPLVSIITIHFNLPQITCALLDSLQKITYPNIEIIIVDNSTKKDLCTMLEYDYPSVTLIENDSNVGFAAANNLGIQQASGKYLLLLNNDTEVESDFLESLVRLMESNEKIGAVSPKICFFNAPEIIQYAGSSKMNPYTVTSFSIGYLKNKNQFQSTTKETFFAHGAAMMISKKVWEKVGKMPEIYFLYYEELDWCEAIKNQGYQIYFVNESIVYHKQSMSIGKWSPLQVYYKTRNRILFLRRNYQGRKRLFGLLYLYCIAAPYHMLTYAFQFKFHLLAPYWSGLIWNFSHRADQ